MNEGQWFVYIIRNTKDHFYTGITTDIARRFNEHAGKKKGAKFFKTGAPVEVVFQRMFPNRSLASKFEVEVKKLSRKKKELLIMKGLE
jgi:putative endonuclease